MDCHDVDKISMDVPIKEVLSSLKDITSSRAKGLSLGARNT